MYCYIYLLLGANYQNRKSDNLTKTEIQIVLAQFKNYILVFELC